MTEEEAKTKWCPFAAVNNGEGNTANRSWDGRSDSPFATRSRCLTNACMAWRGAQDRYGKGVPNRGFCGLTGTGE